MALPIIPKVTFNVKNKWLPKKGLDLQPFTVGQESLLITLKEDSGKDKEKLFAGVKQVIQECIQTPEIELGDLPVFVLEEMFIRLRQHSISEKMDFTHTCQEEVEEKPCLQRMDITLDLQSIKIIEEEGFTNKFELYDNIGITFKHPTLDIAGEAGGDDFKAIIACIDKIYEGEEVHDASNYDYEAKVAFFNSISLPKKQEIIENFFNKLPHIYHKIETNCPKCKAKKLFEFPDLESVFI